MKSKKSADASIVASEPTFAAARAIRETLPHQSLAAWNPKPRKKSVETLLAASLKHRVPTLTALRWQRMSLSAFGFFRGSACVMAYDLSLSPHTGILAQLCGDAHVQNLGAYEGPDGRLIFDINDFDETCLGPFEWELKRMATSIFLAGRDAKLKPSVVEEAATACLTAYGNLIRTLLPTPVLEAARYQIHRMDSVAPISKILAKAERATPQITLEALTTQYPKGRIFKTNLPVLWRVEGDERGAVLASLKPYLRSLQPERRHFFARFTPLDVAFKVVGTGSVGMRAYVVYLQGNGPADPLFLQVKQELPSCWQPYLPASAKSPASLHQGQRVVDGQRAMQIQSDPLLGFTTIGPHDYLVRQLNDHKASVDIDTLKPQDLCEYATVCGELLARGHARSGDVRQIAGYLGNGRRFNRAILTFAKAYADQATTDWKAFKKLHPSDTKTAKSAAKHAS